MEALNIRRGMSSDHDMRPQDREAFKVAQDTLANLGVPLVTAVDDYVKCRLKLGEDSLGASINDCLSRKRSFTPGIKVQQVIDESTATKIQDRLSKRYLRMIRETMRRIGDWFPGPIAEITTLELNGWVRRGDHSVVTRNK